MDLYRELSGFSILHFTKFLPLSIYWELYDGKVQPELNLASFWFPHQSQKVVVWD